TLALGFLLIPLVCTSYLNDHYTVAKWCAVYAVTLLAGVALILPGNRPELPRPGRATGVALAVLAGLYLVSALVNWPGAYENEFRAWVRLLILSLASYRFL